MFFKEKLQGTSFSCSGGEGGEEGPLKNKTPAWMGRSSLMGTPDLSRTPG